MFVTVGCCVVALVVDKSVGMLGSNIWLSSAKIMGKSIISCVVKFVGGGKFVLMGCGNGK